MYMFNQIKNQKLNTEAEIERIVIVTENNEAGNLDIPVINRMKGNEQSRCEICDKSIRTRANYLTHTKIHVSDYFCRICCNSYNSKFKLDVHLSSHNRHELDNVDTNSVVECAYNGCDESFASKLQLFNHRKQRHMNKSEFGCDVCGQKFARSWALDAHLVKHEVVRLACNVCTKVFANKKTLKEHERLHTGEMPYECGECGKKFRCGSGLRYHAVSHQSAKKYKCTQCMMTFARSNYLKEHLRRHLNERPFACRYCVCSFTQQTVLKRHVKNMHRTCPTCGQMTGNIREFREHMWREHKVNE